MTDPYEVDDEGNVVAETSPEEEALRRQVAVTLRFMAISTIAGLVVIAILAVVLSGSRGVLILVGIVYLVTSVVAYGYLRHTFDARLKRGVGQG